MDQAVDRTGSIPWVDLLAEHKLHLSLRSGSVPPIAKRVRIDLNRFTNPSDCSILEGERKVPNRIP